MTIGWKSACITVSSLALAAAAWAGPEVRPGWPRTTDGSVRSSPLVAPAGVGGATLAVCGSFDGAVYAWHLDGTPVAGTGVLVRTGGPIHGSPAWGDVDGDGRKEIVIGSFDGNLYLIRIDESGTAPIETPPPNTASAPREGLAPTSALADAGDDAGGFATSPPMAAALSGAAGETVHVVTLPAGDGVYSTPALGQLDDDPALEIVFGNYRGQVVALNGDGTPVAGWPFATRERVYSSAALANLDDDPYDEVVIGSYDGSIYGLDHDGRQRFAIPTGGTVVSSPSVGPLAGDASGLPEIAVGSSDGYLYAFDAAGAPLPGFPLRLATGPDLPANARLDCDASPTLVDLDLDGRLDIVAGADTGLVHALSGNGTYLPGFPVHTGGEVFSSAAVADADGDGVFEVYVGSGDGLLYGLLPDGSAVEGFPFDFQLAQEDRDGDGVVENCVNASPAVGDFDNDGRLELAVGVYEEARLGGRLYLLELTEAPRLLGDLDASGTVDGRDALHYSRRWQRNDARVASVLGDGESLAGPDNLRRLIACFGASQALAPAAQWPTFRANPARNGIAPRSVLPAGSGTVEGRVVDGRDRTTPLAGAHIEALRDEAVIGAVTAGADGRFRLVLPGGPLTLAVTAEGFASAVLPCTVVPNQVTVCSVALLAPVGEEPAIVTGLVLNAVDTSLIDGARVALRRGIDVTEGPVVAEATAEGGVWRVEGLSAGSYTAVGSAEDFQSSSITVVALAGATTSQPDLLLSPVLEADQARIVLRWGALPDDLDSHLTGPLEGTDERFHVYYSSPGELDAPPYANLDIDDTTSYGPETITISRIFPGIYRYSVHNYSGGSDPYNTDLSDLSGAVVDLFIGEQRLTFPVPSGRAGTIWNVFELDGTTGRIEVLNRFRSGSSGDITPFRVGAKRDVDILNRLD